MNAKRKSLLLAPITALLMLLVGITPAHATDYVQTNPGWALDRIDQTSPNLDNTFTTHTQGAGVNIYIVDTGINYSNPDFGGRAHFAYDEFPGGDGSDCLGSDGTYHGTAVAENAAGATYGVAKQATLWSVKIDDCKGNGTINGFVSALQWIQTNAHRPAVVNISHNWNTLGYYDPIDSSTLRTAVDNLAASGIFVTVSAGNYSPGPTAFMQQYAEDNPPADAAQALVVMACMQDSNHNDLAVLNHTTSSGGVWSTSIAGNIYAPGQAVPNVDTGPGASAPPYDGTSFAAPMAAGVAALYKATYGDADSATIKAWILAHATPNEIVNNPGTNPSTPNLLLNTGGL